jgi:hypothetical protein
MESRKIQRLEFILDKIEDRDSKREVIRICFGHPTKKMSLCEAPHGRRPWPDLKLHGSSPESGRRRGRRGGAGGGGLGGARGAPMEGVYKGRRHGGRGGVLSVHGLFCYVLLFREEERERKEKERRKKEKKKKEKKKEKI